MSTHTYSTLEVSPSTIADIHTRIEKAVGPNNLAHDFQISCGRHAGALVLPNVALVPAPETKGKVTTRTTKFYRLHVKGTTWEGKKGETFHDLSPKEADEIVTSEHARRFFGDFATLKSAKMSLIETTITTKTTPRKLL